MTRAGTTREQGRTCLLTMRKVTSTAESGTIAIVFGAESTSGKGSSQGNASCAHLRALSMSLPLFLPEGWSTARGSTTGDFGFRRRAKGGHREHIRFGRQARSETIVKPVMVANKCCWPSTNQLLSSSHRVTDALLLDAKIMLARHVASRSTATNTLGQTEHEVDCMYIIHREAKRSPKIDTSGACFFCKTCRTPQPSREKLSWLSVLWISSREEREACWFGVEKGVHC